MESAIQVLQRLIHNLPQKDIAIANKFLNERKFEDLLEIVNSDIYLVKKHQKKEPIKEEYASINLESIIQLKSELLDYMSYLMLPEDDLKDPDEYYEDYE